jgi:ribosomal protein L11 methylase PrmA
MLRMAEVGRDDYMIDFGSGDGRIIIEAAKRGARGLGVDIDPNLVKNAAENATEFNAKLLPRLLSSSLPRTSSRTKAASATSRPDSPHARFARYQLLH